VLPTLAEFKILHKTIKKINDDILRFSFNTSVSALMICVNELSDLKCNKRIILKDLTLLMSPFAPHIAEELWQILGNKDTITKVKFPETDKEYLVESTYEYPVSVNGKMRFKLELPLNLSIKEIEEEALRHEVAQKWLDGKLPKKVIVIKEKIVNIVI
jgi:leucyl-tRNA synthetase